MSGAFGVYEPLLVDHVCCCVAETALLAATTRWLRSWNAVSGSVVLSEVSSTLNL